MIVAELASTVGRLTIVAESVPQPVAKITLPELSHTVRAVAEVGVVALLFTVTVTVVDCGLGQPEADVQAIAKLYVPGVSVLTVKELIPVVAVLPASGVIPNPPPAVTPDVPVALVPDVTDVEQLPTVNDRTEPWQTEIGVPAVPPAIVAPVLATRFGLDAGDSFTVTDRLAIAVLEQPKLFTQAIVYTYGPVAVVEIADVDTRNKPEFAPPVAVTEAPCPIAPPGTRTTIGFVLVLAGLLPVQPVTLNNSGVF